MLASSLGNRLLSAQHSAVTSQRAEPRSTFSSQHTHTAICSAARTADGEVAEEWAGLLDPGQGTTRSRGRSKRPALRAKVHLMLSMAVSLAQLTTAQLNAIQHLLSEPIFDAVLRARVINGTNQGRSREEKLIAKLLISEHTDPELAEIEAAMTAIRTPGGSKQGTSPSMALAESWCNRLLALPESDRYSTQDAVKTSQNDVEADAPAAEQEVIDAIIAAGEDLSHFRALLRKARRKIDEAACVSVNSAAGANPVQGSEEDISREQDGSNVQVLEGLDTQVSAAYFATLGRKDPKLVAKKRAAKRARAALLKYVRSVAEFTVVAA